MCVCVCVSVQSRVDIAQQHLANERRTARQREAEIKERQLALQREKELIEKEAKRFVRGFDV